MDINEAKQVLDDYKKGVATLDQKKMVENWYMAISREQELNSDEEIFSNVEDNIWEAILKRTGLAIEQPNHHRSKLWPRVFAAASILIFIGIGFYFYQNYDPLTPTASSQHDIAPGGNKAFLTLANGKRITLTDAKNGELAEQSGVKITKATDGQLVYTVSNVSNENNKKAYNIIETPRGGTYQVRLPDGTKVWLNAASTLRFPSSFARLVNRRVELLSGEAYFEVTKDKAHPFIVKSNGQEVEVLGTHFNINSYLDERSVKTTLLEGSIRLTPISKETTKDKSILLKPNEQALLSGKSLKVTKADAEEAVAWKNGFFIFNDEKIESIIKQIARWYDVEVEFRGKVPKTEFSGKISQKRNISAVLEMLEFTGSVHFKLKGRKVIVME